jgi:hypothetical protein
MKTQEEHVQEAAVAQEKLHQIVVAAGILTEQEAKDYLIVRAGDKSKLPVNLPADAVPHECSSCGYDHAGNRHRQGCRRGTVPRHNRPDSGRRAGKLTK